MANLLPEGTYKGKISNYTISETKQGDPQVAVLFDVATIDGTHQEMTWYGSLKEGKEGKKGPRDFTLEALLKMGMKGNDLETLIDGVEGGALDIERDLNLVVEHEVAEGGKTFARVRWVNYGSTLKSMDKAAAKAKLGMLGLKGAMAMIRQQTGIKDEPRKPKPAPAPAMEFTTDDIPF